MTRLPAILLAAFALAASTGCQTLREDQRSLLVDGERAYQADQYEAAIERLTRFMAQVQDHPETARALYVRGMAQARAGHRPQAYSDLRRAAISAHDTAVAWRAFAVLGVLSFEDEDWIAATDSFTRAVGQMPSLPPMDALLYRLGLCHERTGRWADALTAYRRIVSAFPAGRYAARADRRLQIQANCFAVQVGVFSRQDGALRQVGQLADDGLEAYVRRELRDNELHHVVLVGRYESYSQAVAAVVRVRAHVPTAQLWP